MSKLVNQLLYENIAASVVVRGSVEVFSVSHAFLDIGMMFDDSVGRAGYGGHDGIDTKPYVNIVSGAVR